MWTHYLTTKTQDILVWMGWILLYSHVILSQIIMLSLRLWFFTPAFIENIVSGEDLSIIFFDCISAEAVFETYPHMVRICFFCIDKCSVSQREWWIQTPHLSLRSCQSLSQTKQDFGWFVLGRLCYTLCSVYFPEFAKNVLYNYIAKRYDQYYLCRLRKKYTWNN